MCRSNSDFSHNLIRSCIICIPESNSGDRGSGTLRASESVTDDIRWLFRHVEHGGPHYIIGSNV